MGPHPDVSVKGTFQSKSQGPAEGRLAWVWPVRSVKVVHEMDRSLNLSPEMSFGVLERVTVMLQNDMLTILW